MSKIYNKNWDLKRQAKVYGLLFFSDLLRMGFKRGFLEYWINREKVILPLVQGKRKRLFSPYTPQQLYYIQHLRKRLSSKEIKVLLGVK